MMLDALLDAVRQFGVTPFFGTVAVVLIIYTMTRNYRALRHESVADYIEPGETVVRSLEVDWWWMRTKTAVTDRRLVQLRLGWLFSTRRVKTVALADVHSIAMRRRSNWPLLWGAWLATGWWNPIALVALLLGLQSKLYSVRFDTPFASMPWTRLAVATPRRSQLSELLAFRTAAQAQWQQVRLQNSQVVPSMPAQQADTDFAFGRSVLVFAVLLIAAAFAQRTVGHVTLDDYALAPLFLALPIAVAWRSRRDAVWIGLLTVICLFVVKFPGSGLWGLAFADGGSPWFEQYILVAGVFMLTAVAAGALTALHPAAGVAALLAWPLFLAAYSPASLLDLSFAAKLLIAAAATVPLAYLDAVIANARARTAIGGSVMG